MTRPFLSPEAFARRADRIAQEAENSDRRRLQKLGEKIARAKSKRLHSVARGSVR